MGKTKYKTTGQKRSSQKATDAKGKTAVAARGNKKRGGVKVKGEGKGSGRKVGEGEKDLKKRAGLVYEKLEGLYPGAKCALEHRDAYELLVATILSAQCTDKRVNMVTPGLFKKYPKPADLAGAGLGEIEEAVRTTGFYRNKAKAIQGASRMIVEQHGGKVPDEMEALTALPGVARKTANVVLGNAYGKNEGVVVDTHVGRLSQRLGLTKQKDPQKIEKDLMGLFDQAEWTMLAHLLIEHGRAVCAARKPKCNACALADVCPRVGV